MSAIGTQLMCSTHTYDTPSEQRQNALSWPRDLVDGWSFVDGLQPGSDTSNGDVSRSVDDFFRFPVTPSIEQQGHSYPYTTIRHSQHLLDARGIQNGSIPASHQVHLLSSINPTRSIVIDDALEVVINADATGLELPLQNESPTVPPKKPRDLVLSPKKRGRKRSDPFTSVEQIVQREKFLARNRSAATRCRHRKKQEIEELKERHVELQRANTQLAIEGYRLTRELESLNGVVMSCGNCFRRRSVVIDNVHEDGTAFNGENRALSDGDVVSWSENGGDEDVSNMSAERRSTFSSHNSEGESYASSLFPQLAADKLLR